MKKYTILFDPPTANIIADNEDEAKLEAVKLMGIIFTPSKNNPCTADCMAHARITNIV